ncbi:octanoyltransferase [Holotrichia oblita]|uniref:Octanoyltransferase n=2 Tax=Holotrichia oblita TaxID=644536 RepID=A0ACB9SX18_HOLOL|nr:hypothetical protein MML48_6g00017059 [Holotrichia oblita]KAI4459121.1 octanoyltransferase [Holotrichia oblita]
MPFGGCGGATGILDDNEIISTRNPTDSTSMDAVSSRIANPSIGEASLASGSQLLRDVDRESASTVALAGSVGAATSHKLEVQADLASAQRLSISSLSDKSVNVSLADDGAASTRALAGSMLNYKATNGSDSCSCVTTGEDCISERVRFDDNISFIATHAYEGCSAEKSSIGSSCSFRARSCNKSAGATFSRAAADKTSDTLSNDSIFLDIGTPIVEEKPRKYSSTAAALRSQFFHTNASENKPRSLDGKIVIEVSNEAFDGQPISPVHNSNGPPIISATVEEETSKLYSYLAAWNSVKD